MIIPRAILVLGATLTLGACVVAPPPAPALIAAPGSGKDPAAFQQDDLACRQQAQSAAENSGLSYAQCMTAHGDIMQQAPADAPYPYGWYPFIPFYPYAYPYAYPGAVYWGGFYGGWGRYGVGGWHGGWHGGGHR
jgi:hypothetical protein